MKRGGGIQTNDVYKHILSIGFELETADLAKLSLNDNRLINTNSVFNDLKNENTVKLDENYYMFSDETLENGSFVEYMYDVNNANKSFAITNDVSTSDLEEYCESQFDDVELSSKDDLFKLEMPNRKIYDINFTNSLKQEGFKFTFSGVEWVSTFYNPKKSKNIILETFVNSLKQLFHNLDSVVKQPCKMIVNGVNIDKTQNRILFNKPGTDLYYLQKNYGRDMDLNDVEVIPQMTFRSNVVHTASIMKEILLNEGKDDFMRDYRDIESVETFVDEIIYRFHLKPRKIRLNAHVRAYLFFIFFKIFCYCKLFIPNKKFYKYFKEVLIFQSRHPNYAFYKQILEFMQTKYSKEESVELFIELINHPDLVIYYFYGRKNKEKAIREISEKSFLFGDPNSSFLSYFHYFEKKNADWFSKKLDAITSLNEVKDHTVLFEYRYFHGEITNLTKEDNFSIGFFRKFVSSMENIEDLENHEFNAKTGRWVRKCKAGFRRNTDFQCRKTRKNLESP